MPRRPLPALTLFVCALSAQTRFNEELSGAIKYRNPGPFRAGGWVADIAVPEASRNAHLYRFYVGGPVLQAEY